MQRWLDFGSLSSSKKHALRSHESTIGQESGIEGVHRRFRNTDETFGLITINVGGRVYKVKKDLLNKKKNTLLESVAKGKSEIPSCYKNEKGDYFFDRQPDVFHFVLKFYETEELHVPSNICSRIVKKELKFWNIRDIRLEPCCWKLYNSRLTDLRDLQLIMAKCSILDNHYNFLSPLLHGRMLSFRRKLQSIFAVMGVKDGVGKAYNAVFIVITLLNFVLTISISVLPDRYARLQATRLYSKGNLTMQEILAMTKPMFMHLGIDLLFTVLFIMDQAFRLLASNNRKRFWHNFLNINDFLCNVVSVVVVFSWFCSGYLPLLLENLSHFFRAIRMLRMMRHSRGLMMIIYTIQVRILDIGFMLAIFLVLIVLLGTAIFISELCGADLRSTLILNLPMSFYWAGTTLTTVGYGDVVPTSSFSYIIAVIAASIGMYIIFLPIPLLARQFCLYYNVVKIKTNETPLLVFRMRKRKNMYF